MGNCYSQCEETITPFHLGNAVLSYHNQHEPEIFQKTGYKGESRNMTGDNNQRVGFGYPSGSIDREDFDDISNDDDEKDVYNSQSYESEFPSLSNSAVAIYAKKRVSVKGLPPPGSPNSTFASVLRLKTIVRLTQREKISKAVLLENLLYILHVIEKTYVEETKRLRDEDDVLSETACTEVPDEVRDWLASTFTRNPSSGLKRIVKPRFRSVVNAIRAGIVVDRIYRRMSSCTCLTIPPNVVLYLKAGLDEWNFDVFEFNEVSSNHALKFVGFELLHKYNLIAKFQIDGAKLENLLLRLEIGYSKFKNPYHNLIHATDVAQTCHVILTTSRLRDYLTDLDIFAVIYAALIHDFEHTGTTNSFHVQMHTELALLYNDRNILENYHVSAVFRITQEAEFNIFEKMTTEQYQEFRTAVIDMVLNTDMSLHFSQMKTMKNLIAIPEIIDKLKALSLLVHCADIAHPCKQWDLHRQWSDVLSEEFFRQGDKEKQLGMACSPLCDRNTVVLPQSQIGFIDFIVEPVFVILGDMLSKMMENAINAKEEGNDEMERDRRNSLTGTKLASLEGDEGNTFPPLDPWTPHLKENKENWLKELKQLEEKKEKAGEKKTSEGHKDNGDDDGDDEEEDVEEEVANVVIASSLSADFDNIDYIDRDGETEPTT